MKSHYIVGLCCLFALSCAAPDLERERYEDIFGLGHGGFTGYFDAQVTNIHTGHRGLNEWSPDTHLNYLLRKFHGTVAVNDTVAQDHSRSVGIHTFEWGGPQIWRIEDQEGIGSFDDTVIAPKIFNITTPSQVADPDSISKSRGFIINYTDPDIDSIRIELSYDVGLSQALDKTISLSIGDTIWTMHTGLLPNTGQYVVPPESLVNMPQRGVLSVRVIAPRLKVVKHWHHYYALRAISEAETDVWIKP